MRKRTKTALGIGAASAAAVAAGILLSATPAFAEESGECTCTVGEHKVDCACGCGEAAKVTEEKQAAYDSAKAKKDKAQAEAEEAGKKAAEDKDAYDKAMVAESEAIAEIQKQKTDDENNAFDSLTEANVKAGQAETAANDTQEEAEAAKAELDKAEGYRDGTLPIEETDEYKAAQVTQTVLDDKTMERDAADEAFNAAGKTAEEKKYALEKAAADEEAAQKVLTEKTEKEEAAAQTAGDAKAEHDADTAALKTAEEEKAAAEKDVTDKTAEKAAADKAKQDKAAESNEAAVKESAAQQKDAQAKAALEDYKKEVEKKNNSYAFFKWLSENTDVSAAVREDAALAARLLNNELTENDKKGFVSTGNSITYENLIKYTAIGDRNDATHLDNLIKSLDWIEQGNAHRAEEADPKPALTVSSKHMAISEADVNYLAKRYYAGEGIGSHTNVFASLDNLAYELGYLVQNGKPYDPKEPYDPYNGWYYEEKKNYESQNGGETGHYETLVGNHQSTGYAFLNNYEDIEENLRPYFPNMFYEYSVHNQSFGDDTGLSVSEYRDFVNAYKNEITAKLDELQSAYDSAHAEYESAKKAAEDALAAKEAAEKAAQDAAAALTQAQAVQAEKQQAYETAIAKEAASKDKLEKANEALAAAKQETETARTAANAAKQVLDRADAENTAAQKTLESAQEDKAAKQQAYEKALAEDEAADKALAALTDVESRQAAYEAAAANAKTAADEYEAAKKEAADAQAAYSAAQEAKKAADAMTVNGALEAADDAPLYSEIAETTKALKAALAAHEQAQADLAEKEKANIDFSVKLNEAKAELDRAKTAQETAEKLCESHIVEHKDVLFKFNYKDGDGNIVEDVIHTEFYVDDNYIPGGEFGHTGLTVNTRSVLKIFSLGQTGGLDEYRPRETGDDIGGDVSEGYFVRFVKTRPEGAEKDELMAVLTDKAGNILSGDWFVLSGADLKDGNVELTFLLDKIAKDTEDEDDTVTDTNDDTVSSEGTDGDTSSVTGRVINNAPTTGIVSRAIKSAGSSGAAANVTAANTGDKGYAAAALYTVLAAGAVTGLVIALKRKKRTER